ncbi:hypothetical protein ACI2KR_27280 [Pseudomonas luteola]
MSLSTYDSITGGTIVEGQHVVSLLLTHEPQHMEEGCLYPHIAGRPYKALFVPVHGVWDGEGVVIPKDFSDFQSQLLLNIFETTNYVEVQQRKPVIPGPDNTPYMAMIVSRDTLKYVRSMDRVLLFCGQYEPERFVKSLLDAVSFYQAERAMLSDEAKSEIKDYVSFEPHSRMFRNDMPFEFNNLARNCRSEKRTIYSTRLREELSRLSVFGEGLIDFMDSKRGPAMYYKEALYSFYEMNYLSEALFALSKPLQPSCSYSGVPIRTTQADLSLRTALVELQAMKIGLVNSNDEQSQALINKFDAALEDMRSAVSLLQQERDKIGFS